jgi:hypothetical protein
MPIDTVAAFGLESEASSSEEEENLDAGCADIDEPTNVVPSPSGESPRSERRFEIDLEDEGIVSTSPGKIGQVASVLPEITAASQKDDEDWRELYHYLDRGVLPETKQRRYEISRMADDFVLDDGILVKVWVDMAGKRRRDKAERLVAVPGCYRAALLEAAHDSRYGGGHFDFRRTYAQLKTKFVWPRMAEDVREYCKTCRTCQLRNAGRKRVGPLQPIPIPSTKWELMSMDIVGPLPKTSAGNRFALVMTDYASRWPEAVALPDQEATTLAEAFINKWIGRWGVPKRVITDQGTNFTSAVVQLAFHQLGITRNPTTPYHPQSNGLVERYNGTLKATISKLASGWEAEWDKHIDWALASYRFTINAGLGDSPFFVVNGQDPSTPLTSVSDTAELEDQGLPVGSIEWKREFFSKMQQTMAETKATLESIQEGVKQKFDKSINPLDVQPGDLVKVAKRSRGRGRKLQNKFMGPYRVLGRGEHSDNVVVVDLGNGRTKHLNIAMVKPYYGRATPSNRVCVVRSDTSSLPAGPRLSAH